MIFTSSHLLYESYFYLSWLPWIRFIIQSCQVILSFTLLMPFHWLGSDSVICMLVYTTVLCIVYSSFGLHYPLICHLTPRTHVYCTIPSSICQLVDDDSFNLMQLSLCYNWIDMLQILMHSVTCEAVMFRCILCRNKALPLQMACPHYHINEWLRIFVHHMCSKSQEPRVESLSLIPWGRCHNYVTLSVERGACHYPD